MRKVFVLGSINMDLVMSTNRMPKIGESLIGHGFVANQGGKGANQAVACAKLGCDCYFLGAVGSDSFGGELEKSICSYGVKTSALQHNNSVNSGTCIIIVDEKAKDNFLLVDLGANAQVNSNNVCDFLNQNAQKGDIFVTQLEINLNAVKDACNTAKELGMYVILNPAPACKIDKDIFSNVDLIVPNETEVEFFTGNKLVTEDDAINAYKWFNSRGVKEIIVTLGARGSVYVKDNEAEFFGTEKVESVDPTSAGDTFIGAIAYKLSIGESIEQSIPFAAKCASITVTRKGAASSIPTLSEVKKVFGL